MTPEETQKKVEQYKKAITDLEQLRAERQAIVQAYVKQLEDQKIADIRHSLGLTD